MLFSRRGFLKSLSRTALVLSLEDVLSLARPLFGQAQKPKGSARQSYEAPTRPAPKGPPSPVTGTPLGVQFVDVAKEAGLNVEMIFGGEHRNKYLLETTGCGAAFGSGSGWLTSSLADAGIHPADVTDVVLTHAHPDHIGGLLGPDSSLTFPHAQIHISDIEYKFWIQDAPDFSKSALNNTDTIRQVISSTHAALKVLRPRLQFFADGDQLWGFIRLQKAAGHTPGHTLVHIFSDGDELVHIADLLHSDALQFAHPDWAFYGDTDRELAAATRQQVLAALSAGRKKVFAYHLPWPGIGHARRKGDEYEWVVESHPIPG